MKARIAALAVLWPALALGSAATGVVGVLGASGGTYFASAELIDLVHPATAAGDYTSATVYWQQGGAGNPCAAAFKVRFYHPSFKGSTDLAFVAERGPFDVPAGDALVTVPLSPPVTLAAGDLISVVGLLGISCGAPALTNGAATGATLLVNLDDSGHSLTICDGALVSGTLSAHATMGGTEVRSGIITGAGSAHGAGGLNAKTEIQAVNPSAATINVKLVFHPIGHSGSPSDPSVSFPLGGFEATRIADIGDALNVSGLGSIDIVSDSSYPPLVLTHVFNDAGAAGTSGFSEPAIRPGDVHVLETFDSAVLVVPGDLARYRMNIGVRTLSEGVSLSITVRGANGGFKKIVSLDYAPDVFDQKSASDFLGGFAVSANDTIQVQISSGRAIVFGVSVDNTTKDGSLQLGTRTRF